MSGIKEFDFLCHKIKITNYTPDIRKGFETAKKPCFVCFSDLHLKKFGYEQELLLATIDSCKPDAVFIAGDVVNSNEPERLSEAVAFLRKLADKYLVFYAPGNHEEKLKRYEEEYYEYVSRIHEIGIIFLDNTSVEYDFDGFKTRIYGLSPSKEFYYKNKDALYLDYNQIKKLIGESSEECYNILLAHTPEYFEEYIKWKPDLILSGHYHGGICRLPVLGGVISPKFKLFPKYDYGAYSKDYTTMIVSSGLGYHTIPARVFNPSEIICIRYK